VGLAVAFTLRRRLEDDGDAPRSLEGPGELSAGMPRLATGFTLQVDLEGRTVLWKV
jgi:hypothetical protein